MHSDPGTTVPGNWLLFALNLNGVPSVAAPSAPKIDLIGKPPYFDHIFRQASVRHIKHKGETVRSVVTGLFVGLLLLAHPSQAATPATEITLSPMTPGPVLVDWVDRWGRLHYEMAGRIQTGR